VDWSVNYKFCELCRTHELMATRPDVKPNRRGARSREVVLDAAERVMAEHGPRAATARIYAP
jgi:hypothetical protein